MKHWIDTSSNDDNVYVIDDSTLFIGSCDKEHHQQMDEQLTGGKSAGELLGSANMTTIPYTQMLGFISRSTDINVDIKYKSKDGPESMSLDFNSVDQKSTFVDAIGPHIPETLQKTEYQQNSLAAALMPLYSLALCVFVVFFYVNKFRWPVVIIGGLWAAASLWLMVDRVKTPPIITRWVIKGRHVRKAWYGLKSGVSFLMLLAVVAGVSFSFPDSYGEKAISDRLAHDMLQPADVKQLVSRGADIDYVDSYGETPLYDAINWAGEDLAIALVEAGADLTQEMDGYSPLAYTMYTDENTAVVEAMLKKGASLDFTLDDYEPLDYALATENHELADVIKQFIPTAAAAMD